MKEKERIHYLLALTTFQNWFDSGVLSREEFQKIEGLIADKYGLKEQSIYRYKACY